MRSIDEITFPNITYKIISDIDLGGTTLTISANCTLDFQGGSFSNGTIVGSNTKIEYLEQILHLVVLGLLIHYLLNILELLV